MQHLDPKVVIGLVIAAVVVAGVIYYYMKGKRTH